VDNGVIEVVPRTLCWGLCEVSLDAGFEPGFDPAVPILNHWAHVVDGRLERFAVAGTFVLYFSGCASNSRD
jgi:hypothetical protein